MITRKPVVLIAPLDWGYGHTIRCIPIITELLKQGCRVLVACNSVQKLLLAQEFSSIDFISLEGYNIYYGKNRLQTICNLLLQIPKILIKIKREQTWLTELLDNNHVDAVVSDNRYGLFSANIPCILITHQLRVRSGLGNAIDRFIQKYLYSQINKFSSCWVPDSKNPALNAGGQLSHPARLPQTPVQYIGCLSRFEKCIGGRNTMDIMIVLSGPEPQRTILEKTIISQLKTFEGTGLLIRGVITGDSIASVNNVSVLNYVSSTELNRLLCNSEIVICRAGYTSIMDILKLGKKAVLIPTPGQAEQEYLAVHMHRKKLAYMANQQNFCLKTILGAVKESQFDCLAEPMDQFQTVIQEFARPLRVITAD